MILSCALIIISVILAVIHTYLFSSLFSRGFTRRFEGVKSGLRRFMMKENREFMDSFGQKLKYDPEPPELLEFGERWKKKLAKIDALEDERERMSSHVQFVYWLILLALAWAVMGLFSRQPLVALLGYPLNSVSVSTLIILITAFSMVYYLYLFRRLEDTISQYEAEIEELAIAEHLGV